MPSILTHRIRPAGRHILTIGKELIRDKIAAVIELVKNAYDADAGSVVITFDFSKQNLSKILIEDDGHGMSLDTMKTKWLTLSTNDKEKRQVSPIKKRRMQGRKGIGRFSVASLGEISLVETVHNQEKTSVLLEWEKFENSEYLDEIEVLLEVSESRERNGTRIAIDAIKQEYDSWTKNEIGSLCDELRKFIIPSAVPSDAGAFDIIVKTMAAKERFGCDDIAIKVQPYPILEAYDYRIFGKVGGDGKGRLTYVNSKIKNSAPEDIEFCHAMPDGCGDIAIDLRVYDRDSKSLDGILDRANAYESLGYGAAERRKVRELLDQINGVGVFRNGFRIRPLGDHDYDWLKLNEKRIQNPSLKISSNQVVGVVEIQQEELSNLYEKSARDGLMENRAYFVLKARILEAIKLIEERRFVFRRQISLKKPYQKIDRAIDLMSKNATIKREISKLVAGNQLNEEVAQALVEIVENDESEKAKSADFIRAEFALYQVQATMAKIVDVVLHDGRPSLGYIKTHAPSVLYWADSFLKFGDDESKSELSNISKGVVRCSEHITTLFDRLDPLASGKRMPLVNLSVKRELLDIREIFRARAESIQCEIKVSGENDLQMKFHRDDFFAIFSNLIENSLYWVQVGGKGPRKVEIEAKYSMNKTVVIEYTDSGPGISSELIDTGVIFEPKFSTKVPPGLGLGMAIAGEASARNGMQLKAISSNGGVHFIMETIESLEDK